MEKLITDDMSLKWEMFRIRKQNVEIQCITKKNAEHKTIALYILLLPVL